MYVTETTSVSKKGKIYHSTLLRESYREGKKVKNRTVGNLSHCTSEEIEAIKLALKHKDNIDNLTSFDSIELKLHLSVGAVWATYQIAKRMSIEKVLGEDFNGKLALWQIIARIIDQGSRLSAVRLAKFHASCEILDVKQGFDENDLYENLKWLALNKKEIEKKLFRTRRQEKPTLFLYDVTSSYLEGRKNELADYGYDRDKKRGKKQIVVGLLCDEFGEPVSTDVFRGNTQDISTFGTQVQRVAEDFGCEQVTFVGDRGMIKTGQIAQLAQAGFHYITAITKPQIKTLLENSVVQIEMFDEDIVEVLENNVRYILRRNPCRAEEAAQIRREKHITAIEFVQKQNEYLAEHPRAQVEIAVRKIKAKLKSLKIANWLTVISNGRYLSLLADEDLLQEDSMLDGCYVLKTDLTEQAASKQIIHDRYKDLQEVERAFRTCKTAHLEMRPWYVRKEESSLGHMLVVMLAYMITRQLRIAWEKFDLTVVEGIEILKLICSHDMLSNGKVKLLKIPRPHDEGQKILAALDIQLPSVLPKRKVNVNTRKKIKKEA